MIPQITIVAFEFWACHMVSQILPIISIIKYYCASLFWNSSTCGGIGRRTQLGGWKVENRISSRGASAVQFQTSQKEKSNENSKIWRLQPSSSFFLNSFFRQPGNVFSNRMADTRWPGRQQCHHPNVEIKLNKHSEITLLVQTSDLDGSEMIHFFYVRSGAWFHEIMLWIMVKR